MSIELKQAAEKALVVLGSATSFVSRKARDQHESVVAELRTAIQQVEAKTDEPVAYVCPTSHHAHDGSMEDGPDYLEWADEASDYEKRVGTPLYTHPAPGVPDALKDHQIAAMVNTLRDIARQFHGHDSLRERIANVLVPALKAEANADEPVAWIRRHPNGALSNELLIHVQVEQVRRDSGAWVPLYTHPAPGVPEFSRIAKRKLDALQEQGFAITGYAIQRGTERGFITDGGFVGWWRSNEAPGVQGAPDGYVLVPVSDLEDAEESIDDYRNGLEFGPSDTSILDRLGVLITAAQAQKGQQ